MKRAWFAPLGWIHRPVSWQGMLMVALALAFCVQVFMAIEHHSQ